MSKMWAHTREMKLHFGVGSITNEAVGSFSSFCFAMGLELFSVAFKGNFSAEHFESLDKLTQESSLEIRGQVRKDSRSPGGYELDIADFKVIQLAENYPITPRSMERRF